MSADDDDLGEGLSGDLSDLDLDLDDDVVAVPGFGFLPRSYHAQLANLSRAYGVDSIANRTVKNSEKCGLVSVLYQQGVVPHDEVGVAAGEGGVAAVFCAPFYDEASCLPATPAGQLSVIPCMSEYRGVPYNTSGNATRFCYSNGTWEERTNYNDCLAITTAFDQSDDVDRPEVDYAHTVYFIGNTLSLLALTLALAIFLSFREMRCLRNKIHTNLFITLWLCNACWIGSAIIQAHFLAFEGQTFIGGLTCAFDGLLKFFHLATFCWMFIEGLFLFLQVQFPLNVDMVKLRHYLMLGWGFPFIFFLCYGVLWLYRLAFPSEQEDDGMSSPEQTVFDRMHSEDLSKVCPLISDTMFLSSYIWPIIILMIGNVLFLIWIMIVVCIKVRSEMTERHKQNLKAARALLIITPLLGITYIITIFSPTVSTKMDKYYQPARALLLSTQGFFITLPYCFFNNEVRKIVKTNWERWKTNHLDSSSYFSRGNRSTRNSITTAGYYSTVMHTTVDDFGSRHPSTPRGGGGGSLFSANRSPEQIPLQVTNHGGSCHNPNQAGPMSGSLNRPKSNGNGTDRERNGTSTNSRNVYVTIHETESLMLPTTTPASAAAAAAEDVAMEGGYTADVHL